MGRIHGVLAEGTVTHRSDTSAWPGASDGQGYSGTMTGTSLDGSSGSRRSSSGPTRAQGLSEKLRINGSYTASLRGASVTGNSTIYEQQYSDTDPFQQSYSISANGRVWGALPIYIRAAASGRPYAPTNIDWTLIWHEDEFDVTYGDVQARLTRNSFVTLDRRTKGVTVTGDLGRRGTYQVFATETKGITRRESIPGEGTSGPYYLQYTPVREETVRVRIDEQDIARGRYQLEPETGRLSFDEELIVLQSSVISVVYEENRSGQARGLFWGGAVDYRLGRMPVAVTYITQNIAGGGSGEEQSVQREEEFIPNSTTGPFQLSYRPIDTTKSVTAYVDGVALTQDVDFTLNTATGVIQFFNIVPATSNLRIVYSSLETDAQADTKKELWGVDAGYRFGALRTQFSLARSQGGLLSNGDPAPGGNAWNGRFSWRGLDDKLDLSGSYQQQDAGFSRIDAATFDRDQSGWSLRASYRPDNKLSTQASWSRNRSRTGLSLGGDTSGGSSTASLSYVNDQRSATAQYQYGDGRIGASLTSSSSSSATAGSRNRSDGATVSWSQRFGSLDASADWSRTTRFASRASTETSQTDADTTTQSRTRTESRRAGLSYRWASRNSVSVSWSDSRTRDLMGATLNSSQRYLSADLTYSPVDSVSISLRKSLNDSSGATYISSATAAAADAGSLRAAYLLRYYGVHALQSSDTTVVDTRTLTDGSSLRLSYRPGNDLSFDFGVREDRYESEGGVGYMADQLRRSYNADVSWDASDSLRLDANWTVSQTTYLQRSRGRVWSSGWGLGLQWSPSRSFSVSAGYNLSDSLSPSYRGSSGGDTGLTILSSTAYDNARVSAQWTVNAKSNLGLEWTLARYRGDLDYSDRNAIDLTYTYRLNNDVQLGAGGRWVNYRDLEATASSDRSYRALSYYAQLRIGF